MNLTDGLSVVFTPDLFGKGITVNTVHDYKMTIDAGMKYKGLSLMAENYQRWLNSVNTGGPIPVA